MQKNADNQHRIGQAIDRYQIISLLHEDSTVGVYKAFDPKFDRNVILYLMKDAQSDGDKVLQTARAMISWRHAGLARLLDLGSDVGSSSSEQGSPSRNFFVQEFIPGPSLQKIQQEMRLADCWPSLQESTLLVRELCMAIEFSHQRGIFHGDLHPGAILFKSESVENLPYQPVIIRTGLIKPGGMSSSPAYRSPEAIRGINITSSADIYSLGAILYELCTGQPPAPQTQTTSGPPQVVPPHLLHRDLHEGLEKIIFRALSPNPVDRFSSANEMANALDQIQTQVATAESAPSGLGRICQLATFLEHSLPDQKSEKSRNLAQAAQLSSAIPPNDLGADTVYVLLPDKSVRGYIMKPEGLSIGRGKENDIPLDLAGISRNHARIDFDGQNYNVTDLNSLNGTYLEQNRLVPEKPEVWLPGENMRIGEAWLRIERLSQNQTTQAALLNEIPTKFASTYPNQGLPDTDEVFIGPDGSPIDSSQVVRSQGLGWVGAFTESLNISVAPGASVDIPILLFNRGLANDSFLVSIQGIPLEWIPNPPQPVRVSSNSQKETHVVIRPPRSPLVKAGRYGLVIRIASQNSTNQLVELRPTLTVTAFSLFASELRPAQLRANDIGQVYVHNRGNLPDTFSILWEDRSHTLVFEPPQMKVNLQIGKSAVVEYRPSLLRPRIMGSEATHSFKVHVNSQGGQTESHQGEYISRGIIPPWAPIVLALLAILLACVLCLLINQVTFPVRRADQTAQANRTEAAEFTSTAVSFQTATSQSLEGANLATLQAATATSAWLGLDDDQDGLSNNLENLAGTYPNIPDSDQDGLNDGVEVLTWKTNPLLVDSDGDGLQDGVEVQRGTNPLQKDTDGDGLNDAVDPNPLQAPTRTPIVFLPTATPRPPQTATPTRTVTPTLSPTANNIDLVISISNGQTNSTPGTTTTYSILVSNKGPSIATNAQVVNQFPATLTNVTWTCTASPGSRCLTPNGIGNINALVDLAVNGTATLTANGSITPSSTGSLANTARVLQPAGLTEINPADNQATDSDTLIPRAALSLSKTDSQDTVFPGQVLDYSIIVFNNGPSTVNGISVQDSFPAQLRNIAWTCAGTTGSSCAATGIQSGNINSQVSLNPGGTATFTINATVRDNASGVISNTASLNSPVDPATNNKSAVDTTTVIPRVNLGLEASAPVSVTTGETLTYTLTITNSGPSVASGVTLTSTLSISATFISALPGFPTCQESGGVVVCDLGDLAANSSTEILIVASAPLTPGQFTNIVDIKATEIDPDPTNNSQTINIQAN